jgi:hypothetical protein
MPHRIGQDLEDVVRGSTDPPRYGNRPVFIVSHETRSLPWGVRRPASVPMPDERSDAPSLSKSSPGGQYLAVVRKRLSRRMAEAAQPGMAPAGLSAADLACQQR